MGESRPDPDGWHMVRLRTLRRAVRSTRQRRDDAIRAAADAYLSTRQIGRAVGLSHARVTQIINEKEADNGQEPDKQSVQGGTG